MQTPEFFTADICDAHVDDVQVLSPGYHSYGGARRCKGEIATVRIYEDNSEIIAVLKEPGCGRILVVDVNGDYCAVVGENLMKLAEKNGWSGMLINGYVRDIHVTETVNVGLWALGTCPRKSPKKIEGERGKTLTFGGVEFAQGCYLYADRDGIVVLETDVLNQQSDTIA